MDVSYEFGPFRADPRECQLRCRGRVIPLTPKAFEILLFLVQHSGRLLTKKELIAHIWPDTAIEEGNLTRNVSSLRAALADKRTKPRYIETVPRRGYRFIAPVRKIVPSPNARASLAVLPFAGDALDADTEYLASGLTLSLTDKLSRMHGLRVLSSSAAYAYQARHAKGGPPDPAEAGRALGVHAVVTGRVHGQDGSLVVDVELIDARDNSHLGGGRHQRRFDDILGMQEALAEDVVDRLRLHLTGGDQQRLHHHDTNSPDAQLLYHKARCFCRKGDPDSVRRALGLFQQAVDIDPGYALAYVGLMDCHTTLGQPAEARRAARTALELDSLLGEAHASMAWAAFNYDWDWEGAERGFRRAIELSPNHAPAHLWYSVVLASMGQHAEARRHIALARELDPLSRSVGQTAGMVLCLAREYDEAAEVLNELIEIDERDALARSTLGLVYAEQGRCHEAVSQFETVLDLAGKFPPIAANVKALIGYAYAAADKTAEARSLAEEVAGGQVSEPYWIAAIYAKLRENDRAFEWLERAVERRSTYLTGLKTAPVVDNLRSDSRFPGLLRQIGLER